MGFWDHWTKKKIKKKNKHARELEQYVKKLERKLKKSKHK